MNTPELLPYLLKVNGALLLFCAGYYLLLRRLTFFRLNRAFLLVVLLFAPLYPLVDFSQWFVQSQPLPTQLLELAPNWQALPVGAAAAPAATNWLVLAYWAGVGVLAVRFLLQLLSLYRLHRRSRPTEFNGVGFRAVPEPVAPFAFWQTVYLNPDQHAPEELPAILCHEQVHVREWHTLDVLLAQLSLLFYWFNPGVWLLRQALHENLEFNTDYRVLQSGLLQPKAYQYRLLQQSVQSQADSNSLVSHFNFHLLKTRIAMMNKPRTAPAQAARYLLLLPLALGLLSFSTPGATSARVAPAHSINNSGADVEKDAPISALPPAALAHIVKEYPNYRLIGVTEVRAADGSNLRYRAEIAYGRRPVKVLFDAQGKAITTAAELLYFLDGKPVTKADVEALNPASIESVNVLKDKGALKSFGEKAENGVMLIFTMKNKGSAEVQAFLKEHNITFTPPTPEVQQVVAAVTTGKGLTENELQGRLLVINGKEGTVAQTVIAEGKLESVYVMDAEKAAAKYGEKGKKGAVVITTKQ
ncbi:M56 family peptidase [Hymenobacter sediminis]|uniref:M56 family metallopeptidase n=1 Tax=Hymenobacter sediminis TaxID=2218621 RepID=UPI000DA68A18|nr:M56 family metallopeptidase [Hymenobacter sediminis]RPD49418.1 M56 family peptidase [Hymenobacter sediminis]